MSLQSFSLKETPSVAVTGTDNVTVASRGNSLTEGSLVYTSDVDGKTRRSASLKVTPPRPSAGTPNGYTQARSIATLKYPLLLDNDATTVNTIQVSISYDIESSDAEIQALLDDAAQIIAHADLQAFWKTQALA